MPSGARQDVDPGILLQRKLRFRFLLHLTLDVPASLVQRGELHREVSRLVGALGGQQADPQVRFPDPPTGINPRAQGETQIAASGGTGQPARVYQGRHADIGAAGHYLEALRDEGSVKAMKRGDIGNCAQSHEIEQG